MSKAAKTFEKRCTKSEFSVPYDFYVRLSEKLLAVGACSPNGNGGFVSENILKAKFQADSVIARRSVENKSDYIMSLDSDFPALLGSKCILLCNVVEQKGKVKRGRKRKSNNDVDQSGVFLKDATAFKVDLAGADNAKMRSLRQSLESSTENRKCFETIEWTEASFPLFKYSNATLRAAIAVTMGCDVFKAGIKGVGTVSIASRIKNMIQNQKINESNEDGILMLFRKEMIENMKKQKASSYDFDALVSAFLYEPGVILNEHSNDNDIGDDYTVPVEIALDKVIQSSDYIFGVAPNSLPEYLKYFAAEGVNIESQSTSICHCPGTHCTKSHSYLAFEGSHECTDCKQLFCMTCSFIPTQADRKKIQYSDCHDVFCLSCFRKNRLSGRRVIGEQDEQPNNQESLSKMIEVLSKDFGVTIDRSADLAETQDIYDTYVSSPNNSRSIHLNAVEKLKYPVYPAAALVDPNDKSFVSLGTFKFSEGGRFISDTSLIPNSILSPVLKLVANFVEYNHYSSKLVVNKDAFDLDSYEHLPTMFINFAYLSRIDEGYRLLERAARHVGDRKTPSIFGESAGLYKNSQTGEQICVLNLFILFISTFLLTFKIHIHSKVKLVWF